MKVLLLVCVGMLLSACVHAPSPDPRGEPVVVELTFTTSTLFDDGTPITQGQTPIYHVWQGERGVPEKQYLGSIVTSAQTLRVEAFGEGEICWQMATEVEGVIGARTNDAACTVIHTDPPDPVDPPREPETYTLSITDAPAGRT